MSGSGEAQTFLAALGPMAAHAAYGLAWASFGAGHSLLARSGVKAALGRRLGAGYRFAYSLVSILHIALVLWVGWWLLAPLPPFALPWWGDAGYWLLLGSGLALFAWGGRSYDLGRLMGTAQLREAKAGLPVQEEEPFHVEGAQRHIRHPLYAAGMLLLAAGALKDPLGLATFLWGGMYLVIGAAMEERDLLRRFGPSYAAYRREVKAWWPRLRPVPAVAADASPAGS